jgi:cob(I)alamin adenosyltransferase
VTVTGRNAKPAPIEATDPVFETGATRHHRAAGVKTLAGI